MNLGKELLTSFSSLEVQKNQTLICDKIVELVMEDNPAKMKFDARAITVQITL